MKPLLICNWKTYIQTEDDARSLAENFSISEKVDMVVCPSAPHLVSVREILKEKHIPMGAQDIAAASDKPQTGNVSGRQLRDIGAMYVLVGHAETRAAGVTNSAVAAKAAHALSAGIVPVVCLSEQDNRMQEAGDEVAGQLKEIITTNGTAEGMIIAYEPTAYIGADTALATAEIKNILTKLRTQVTPTTPVLYGGSVDAGNIKDILENGGADGFLLGRAGSDAGKIHDIVSVL